jgi:phospholipase/carboxylesterase
MPLRDKLIRYDQGQGGPLIVLLHGYEGQAEDLAAFGKSLGVSGHFVFPEGPLDLRAYGGTGHAFWLADGPSRAEALSSGKPRDLSSFEPEGLDRARADLSALLDELARDTGKDELVLGGFSQGAMLALDLALRDARPLSAVVQLSGCRIAERLWNPRLETRRGLPAFISHGTQDPDLCFQATARFQDDLRRAGWSVDFFPFEGGHETPLPVLRRLKKFLNGL